jgi:hypothetical protein
MGAPYIYDISRLRVKAPRGIDSDVCFGSLAAVYKLNGFADRLKILNSFLPQF